MARSESKADRLIADYLRELRVSAWNLRLPRSQTAALVDEARANITAALDAAGNRDEATVHRVLDRLGPPSGMVARVTAEPRTGSQRLIDTALAPVRGVQSVLDVHGWGLAEIVALLLLIVGPFYVWWIAPLFGIVLVRAAANRWSDEAMHRATVLVVSLFAVQALISLALFALALMNGGLAAEQLQRLFSMFVPGGAGGPPLIPPAGTPDGSSLSPVHIILASPAYVAGISSGAYLALNPRHRR